MLGTVLCGGGGCSERTATCYKRKRLPRDYINGLNVVRQLVRALPGVLRAQLLGTEWASSVNNGATVVRMVREQ